MAVTPQRVGAAGRFNQDFRPENSRPDMHRGDLGNADAHFVLAEPRTLVPDDRLVRHFNEGGKQEIPARPPAGLKSFRRHEGSLNRCPA